MRSIVVHTDGTPRCAVRLRLALSVARRLDATVTAAFATTPPKIDPAYAYAASALALENLQVEQMQWRAAARAAFESARNSSQGSARWVELCLGEPLLRGVIEQAFFADLLVLGQHDPQLRDAQVPGNFATSLLIGSGRPGLLVPFAGDFAAVPETALIAWKPSAPAARALSASLPLLRRARAVHVVSWGAAGGGFDGDALDIERYLGLHGVEAVMHRYSDEPAQVGEMILSTAADVDADLLVMGLYAHSRARELVFGGATRTVLQSMTLPVLVSH